MGRAALLTRLTGVTARQLWYWTANGRVRAHRHVNGRRLEGCGGSGTPLFYDSADVPCLEDVARLLEAGLRVHAAFHLASADGQALQLSGGARLAYRRAPQAAEATPSP